jgi:hypothetical protein
MAIAKESGSAPFYKSGPLYAHGPNGTHPTDPIEEAKAKAEAKKKAEANASAAEKVYGETTRTKTTDKSGVTTHTTSTPWTKSGSGNVTTNKTYKQLAAEGGDVEEAKKFNAGAALSGVKTRSFQTVDLKPKGINFTPPTVDITIPKVLKNSKPPMPTFNVGQKPSGGGTNTLIDFNKGNKTKSRSGNSCGCS